MRRFASPIVVASCVVPMDVVGPVVVVPRVKVVMMLELVHLVSVRLLVPIKNVDRMVAASFVGNVQTAPFAIQIPGLVKPYARQVARIKTVVAMDVAAPVASVAQV